MRCLALNDADWCVVALDYILGGNQHFFLSPTEAIETYSLNTRELRSREKGRKGQERMYGTSAEKIFIFHLIVLIYLLTKFGIHLVQLCISKNYLSFPYKQ